MIAKYAYLCDLRQCKNCSFPECSHTTNKNHRIECSENEKTEMRLVGSANDVNYYMEYVKRDSKGE